MYTDTDTYVEVYAIENFDATKLSNTNKTIHNFKCNTNLFNIYSTLATIRENIQSEDSNLASTINNLEVTLASIDGKMKDIISSIEKEIESYTIKTYENELGSEQSLTLIDTELESINAMLDAL